MRIQDLLKVEAIELGVSAASKEAAIDTLVALHNKVGNLADVEGYKAAILKRESESTTAIGEGLAVPHAKTSAAKHPGLAAITVPDGVDYDAPDGQPATLLFMIAAPEGAGDAHLEILSRLMVMLMDPDFGAALRAAKTPEEFLDIINKQEAAKYPEEEAKGPRVVAVTACPTGIAHTYMAAEALEKKGAEMGIPIKVETNGSGGAKNVLTAEEIAGADGVIIAADKNVEMARFDGKPLVKVPVADGIHKAEELITKATSGAAPVYKAEAGAATEEAASDDESTWRKVYKHLMNGVSHMLPFVVGGGILIALSFLFDTIYCARNGLPYGSDFGGMTALSAWFNSIGGAAFGFMLPVLAGFIAMSIADRPGLAVGFVGGYLAKIGATWAAPGGQDVSAVSAARMRDHRRRHVYGRPGHDRHQQRHLHLPELPVRQEPHRSSRSPARPHDGHRYGRPDQQGCLPLRCRHAVSRHRCRLPDDGLRHDRRHGSPDRHRHGLPVLPAEVHGSGTLHRCDQLCHGSLLHHRRCHPVRSF